MLEWLFSWEVTSWVVGGLVAAALAFVSLNDFGLARFCFVLAAADAVGGLVAWGAKLTWSVRVTNLTIVCLSGAIGLLALQSLRYVERKRQEHDNQPLARATVSTRIVGRLYARTKAPPPGQTVNVVPEFQEIFYEWRVSIAASSQSAVSVKVGQLQGNDLYRVEPEGAISERVPEYTLGFKNSGDKPSDYALIVKTDDVSETQLLAVTVRRSIMEPLVEGDLVKLAYVRSSTSRVETKDSDNAADVGRLARQAKMIAEWKHAPRDVPLPIHPPGDIPAGEMQAAIEMWCKNENCQEMTIGNLIAQWNRIKP